MSRAFTRLTHFGARGLRVTLLSLVAAGSAALSTAAPALAAHLSCSGSTIYAVGRNGEHGVVFGLSAATVGEATATMTQVTEMPAGSFPNALGVSYDGSGLYAVQQSGSSGSAKVWGYDTETAAWSSYLGSGGEPGSFVAGGNDPLNGIYYYAQYSSSESGKATLYGFDTLTNTAIPGAIATFKLPDWPSSKGQNGDFTFDGNGNLYVLASDGATRAVGVIKAAEVPASATGKELPITVLSAVPDTNTYNGIAFDNLGRLYLEGLSGGKFGVTEIDPNNGAIVAGPTPYSANAQSYTDVDLASCPKIPTLAAQVEVAARVAPTDQFKLTVEGGSITHDNTATTTGTSTGLQPQVAGPDIATSATKYSVTETAASGSLSNYDVSYSCLDTANGDALIASGKGSTAEITFPTVTLGQVNPPPAITCTFDTTLKKADLEVKDAVAPETALAGGQVTFTLSVANNGPDTATGVKLADKLPAGLSIISVTPAQGSCTNTTSSLSCPLGTLTNGTSTKVTVKAQLAGNAEGSLTDEAAVTGEQEDPTPANNKAAATIKTPVTEPAKPVEQPAPQAPAPPPAAGTVDVQTETRVDHEVATSGEVLTFTVTVTNLGSQTASQVSVVNTPEGAVSVLSWTASRGSCSRAGTAVSCDLGELGVGQIVTIVIRGVLQHQGNVGLRADASSGCGSSVTCTHETNLANNASAATVRPRAQLKLTETIKRRTVKAGGKVPILLSVINPNASALTAGRVCAQIPLGLVYQSSPRRPVLEKGELCWSLGSLARHQVVNLKVMARALHGSKGLVTSRAIATAANVSPARAHAHVMILAAPSPGPARVTG